MSRESPLHHCQGNPSIQAEASGNFFNSILYSKVDTCISKGAENHDFQHYDSFDTCLAEL